jgi:hypothetical protein
MRSKTERRRRQGFSLLDRFSSLRHACNGLGVMLIEQHNARIHCGVALLVLTLGLLTGLKTPGVVDSSIGYLPGVDGRGLQQCS